MNSGFISSAGGTDPVTSYPSVTSPIEIENEGGVPTSISSPNFNPETTNEVSALTRKKRIQLIIQDKANEQLVNKQPSISNLHEHRFKSWLDVISTGMMHLSDKVVKSSEKTLKWLIEEEKQRKYILHCWRNLEKEFRLFLKKMS